MLTDAQREVLAKVAAIKDPVVTLTGKAKEALIASMFEHPAKAKLFGAQYASVVGTLDAQGKRQWDFSAGMPAVGDTTWQFQQDAPVSDKVESERDPTASLGNAR